jgi:hypothetical protein
LDGSLFRGQVLVKDGAQRRRSAVAILDQGLTSEPCCAKRTMAQCRSTLGGLRGRPLTAVVASLSLIARRPGQQDVPVTVNIGTPYQVGEDEWACPVSVRPLYDILRDQHGVDSFQAMFLAMRLALVLLKDFTEKGGILLGFSFDIYRIDFEKNR